MRSSLPWGLLLGVSLFSSSAMASSNTANLWVNAGLELVATNRLTFGVNEELRIGVSEQRIEELNTQLAAAYDATDWLQLAGHYRLDVEGWDSRFAVDQRFGIDGQLSGRFGKVRLDVRQRVQPELSSAASDPFQVILRTRLRAGLDASRGVRPYVAVEPYLVASSQLWNRLRSDVGVTLPQLGLDVSYRLDIPLARPGEPNRHIVTLSYTHTLDPWRKD